MLLNCRSVFGLVVVATAVLAQGDEYAQEYGEYPNYEDYKEGYDEGSNLYQNYAQHAQEKQLGGAGPGIGKLALCSALAWVVGGKIHSNRATKNLKKKFQKEQKALYSQYYNDIYKMTEEKNQLQYQNQQLQVALKETEQKAEIEALQRDYDEFKQPDIDGDDRISRAEFNMYVKNYLSNYPGLQEKDYPKFEDFDHDGDGYVSFQEYTQQMALQVQQAEMEQMYSGGTNKKAEALQGLYGQTQKSKDFNDLYAAYR
uniref:EF-hand domain-containing protein n=1 Tax=Grammatophora oceanica TaxID=210454 RepID=A0A7S1YLG9_9STRA|mmetsp:Transcript_5355/g.7483  ORF Transcript_5355/g.7483 Transcript_5355/m.7483 type:complete len:257 (+) Transcript_5355:106-876(+)